jgi:serine protease Do
MAKPPRPSDPPPSSPRPPSPPSRGVVLAHGALKLAAFVVGLPAVMLCVMALVGALTDNGYARVLGAGAVVLGVPLALADRLLPAHDPARARGLVSDVCAVSWMLVLCAFTAAGGVTRPLLTREGDRLAGAGHEDIARGAYVLAGVHVEPAPAPAPLPASSRAAESSSTAESSSAAASSSGDHASAPAMDGGAARDASAPDASAARAASSAGAPRHKPEKTTDRTPAELFKEVSPSVVTLSAFQSSTVEGGGTGFLIDDEGTIATNHHVIDHATRVRVKFQSGAVFDALELLVDEAAVDLALLRVDLATPVDGARLDLKPLPLADSDEVVVGEHAIVIGNPLGLESTLTDGLVSSRRIFEGRPWIQFSAPISSGNSGGPLLNMRGEVIGVTTASLNARDHGAAVVQNLNLAVPVNELKKLIRTEYPSRRKLGERSGSGHW